MNPIDPTQPLKHEANNNEKTTRPPVAGFNVHPENINRNGRPQKGYSISDCFKEMLGSKKDIKMALVNKITQAALEGDMTAAKMIWNYMDGMPAQATDITTMGEKLEGIKTVILDTIPREENEKENS